MKYLKINRIHNKFKNFWSLRSLGRAKSARVRLDALKRARFKTMSTENNC